MHDRAGAWVDDGEETVRAAAMDTAAIIHEILAGYTLPVRGDHGIVHWARVLENGLRLAEATGANVEVVTLFALFHDCRRVNQKGAVPLGRRAGVPEGPS